jgi:hypothetical protein
MVTKNEMTREIIDLSWRLMCAGKSDSRDYEIAATAYDKHVPALRGDRPLKVEIKYV